MKIVRIIISSFIFVLFLFLFKIELLNHQEAPPVLRNGQPVNNYTISEKKVVTLAIFGDMMFDRYVWHKFKNVGLNDLFSNLDMTKYDNSDIVFANLEGPISANEIEDVWIDDSLNFNMPPDTIEALKSAKINAVSLANNHTLNAGLSGFSNTKKMLDNNGILNAGSQNNFDQNSIIRFDTQVPISIICISFVGNNFNNQLLEAIQQEASANRFIIVYPHWGVEYSTVHNSIQSNLAHSWIENGADLIIGSHPHVMQDIEIFNNIPIIYSLGNFVFDQLFSPETQKGLMVKAIINDEQVELNLLPYKSTNLKPSFDDQIDLYQYIDSEKKISDKNIIYKWR